MLNKKGIGIDDAVPMIMFIIVAALAILFFSFYFNGQSNQINTKIQWEKDQIGGNQLMLAYLRIIDDKGVSKSEFISRKIAERDYDSIKVDLTKNFQDKFSSYLLWRINIVDDSGRDVISPVEVNNYGIGDSSPNVLQVSSIKVPVGNKKYVTMLLYAGRQR